MSLWSEFNASSEDQWIKKVLDDSSNKTAQDFGKRSMAISILSAKLYPYLKMIKKINFQR